MNCKTSHIFTLISSLILFCSSCASSAADMPTGNTTPLPSASNIPKLEPASAPTPLSNADVLISFTMDASDGMDEISACLGAYNTYRFVLYRNGPLIRFDEGRYLETSLSQPEIDKLLSEIEATGFASLIGDGDQYVQNAPAPSFDNTWGGSITVQEKTITITPGQSDYLVEAMSKTLDIIDNYKPASLQLYTPESAILWAFLEQSIILGSANPTPESPDLQWTMDEINLAKSRQEPVSGDSLSFLMRELLHIPALRRVEQNGETHLVMVCPDFP